MAKKQFLTKMRVVFVGMLVAVLMFGLTALGCDHGSSGGGGGGNTDPKSITITGISVSGTGMIALYSTLGGAPVAGGKERLMAVRLRLRW
jgi:hypothetical protein